jgi:hypothetical protein
MFRAGFFNSSKIINGKGQVNSMQGCACVTGCNEQFGAMIALG